MQEENYGAEDNQEEQQSPLVSAAKVNFRAVLGDSPDDHVKAMELARQAGVPVGTAKRKPAEVKAAVEESKFDPEEFAKDNPNLLNYLSDYNNVAASSDDLPILQRLGNTLVKNIDDAHATYKEAERQYRVGVANEKIADLRAKQGFAVLSGSVGLSPEESKELESLNAFVNEQNKITAGNETHIGEDIVFNTAASADFTIENMKVRAGAFVGAFATVWGATSLAGLSTGPAAPGVSAAGTIPAFGAGMTAQTVFGVADNAKRNFGLALNDFMTPDQDGNVMDQRTATEAALVYGIIAGGLEEVSFRAFAKLLPDGVSVELAKSRLRQALKNPTTRDVLIGFLSDGLKAIATEGVTEGLQSFFQTVSENAGRVADSGDYAEFGFEEFMSNVFSEETLDSVMAESYGGATGGFGAFTAISSVSLPVQVASVSRANKHREKLAEIRDITLQSKTFQRSRETFEKFLETANPDSKIYVDSKGMLELFQSIGDPDAGMQLAQDLGIATQLQEAASTGADIEISVSKFVSVMADSEYYDAVVEHSKTSPDDMTPREAVVFEAEERKKAIEEEVAKLGNDYIRRVRENASLDSFYESFKSNLMATGKFDDSTASSYSLLYTKMFETLDERSRGKFAERFGVKVVAGDVETSRADPASLGPVIDSIRDGNIPDRNGQLTERDKLVLDVADFLDRRGIDVSALSTQDIINSLTNETDVSVESGNVILDQIEADLTEDVDMAQRSGLDMSEPARIQRAQEQGFDTGTIWYHGSPNAGYIDAFSGRLNRRGTFFTLDPEFASDFTNVVEDVDGSMSIGTGTSPGVIPVYLSVKDTFDFSDPESIRRIEPLIKQEIEKYGGRFDEIMKGVSDGDWSSIESDPVFSAIRDAGFDSFYVMEEGRKNISVMNPKNVRSVNAAFSPEFSGSSRLLAQDKKPGVDKMTTPGIDSELMAELEKLAREVESGKPENRKAERPAPARDSGSDQAGPAGPAVTAAGGEPRAGWREETVIRDAGTGEPLTVYRGGNRQLGPTHWDIEAAGGSTGSPTSGFGVWMSTLPQDAARFGPVRPYYLDIRNPLEIEHDKLPEPASVEEAYAIRQEWIDQGYDGLMVDFGSAGESAIHLVAFSPEQAVFGNDGSFIAEKVEAPAGEYDLSDEFRESVLVSLSAATGTIPGLASLYEAVSAGDERAAAVLRGVARDALEHLLSGVGSAEVSFTEATGLYGGSVEPSLGVSVEFDPEDRPAVLAALAKFAENFNQEQVHVREAADKSLGIGHDYGDGSYNTVSYRLELKRPLSKEEINDIIEYSGLYGLTATDGYLEAYYVGDATKQEETQAFQAAIKRAGDRLGENGSGVEAALERLWVYGQGSGSIPYSEIAGDVRTEDAKSSKTAHRVAEYLYGEEVAPVQQAKSLTDEQRALQTEIKDAYEAMPLDDLASPAVRHAYTELATELVSQYDAMPIKVEVWTKGSEPYSSSADMRNDVLLNNHLWIFATEPSSFGPEGVVYDNHPLLENSGRKDVNGRELLMNDMLRAVHDYYAHTMSETQFGRLGEEAAWKNHMAMTRSPWARWALTSETRGQNSWVNFRPEMEGKTPQEKGFAKQKVGLLPIKYAMTGDPSVDKVMLELADQVESIQPGFEYSKEREVSAQDLADRLKQIDDEGKTLNQSAERSVVARKRFLDHMYSMVENAIMTMRIPQWKKSDGKASGKEIWQKLTKEPGVKAEELAWIRGFEEALKDSDQKYTRDEVLSLASENSIVVGVTTLESGDGFDYDSVEWSEEVDTDRSNWEYYVDEYIGEYDNATDDESLPYMLGEDFLDRWIENNDWVTEEFEYVSLQEKIDSAERMFIFSQKNEEIDLGEKPDHAKVLQDARKNLFVYVRDLAREDAEEAIEEYSERQYMQNPVIEYSARIGSENVYIRGNYDQGFFVSSNFFEKDFSDLDDAKIAVAEAAVEYGLVRPEGEARFEDYVLPERYAPYINYREDLIRLVPNYLRMVSGEERTYRKESHFREENIIVFNRVTDRMLVGPDGRLVSTYFNEETQSDWHQDGRQEGYASPAKAMSAETAEKYRSLVTDLDEKILYALGEKIDTEKETISETINAALRMQMAVQRETKEGYDGFVGELSRRAAAAAIGQLEEASGYINDILGRYDSKTIRYRDAAMLADIVSASQGLVDIIIDHAGKPGIPDAPFKGDGWLQLAMKHAIIDAVTKGYGAYAWPDSNVLSDRWSEKYRKLYSTQYDTKMPSIVRKLTGETPVHLNFRGEPHQHQELGYFIIPITDEIRNKVLGDGFSLFQERGDKRGSIRLPSNMSGNDAVITLFKDSDLSTLHHEMGHFFLEAMADIASDPDVTEDIYDMFSTTMRWLGVSSPEEISVEHHEKFARGWEAYLFEGKSPSADLSNVFSRFRAWMLAVYRSIKNLDVEINDEIRGVFDRLIASDEEISAKHESDEWKAALVGDAEKIMSKSELESYKQAVADAKEEEKNALALKLMDDAKKEQSRAWRHERRAVEKQVEEEHNSRPVYAAQHWIRTGSMLNGADTGGLPHAKLDMAFIVERMGEDFLKKVPFLYQKDGGIHPDDVAAMFGFSSGEKMLDEIANAAPRKESIKEITDQIMRSRHGDIIQDGKISEVAAKEIANSEGRAKVLSMELGFLSRKNGNKNKTPVSMIREAAREAVSKKSVRDVSRPGKYLTAEVREAKLSQKALSEGDYGKAELHKRRQLLNHFMYRESLKALDDVDSSVNYFRKFGKASVRQRAGKAKNGYLEQIDSLLERFDFKRSVTNKAIEKRKSLMQWVSEQEADGAEVAIDIKLLNEAYRKHYKDMTVEEIRGLRDAIRNIEHIVRLKNRLLAQKEAKAFSEAVDELVESAYKNNKRSKAPIDKSSIKGAEKVLSTLKSADADLIKVETLIDWLDGGEPDGPWRKYVFNPIAEAEDMRNNLDLAITVKVKEVLEKIPAEQAKRYSDVVYIKSMDESISIQGIVAMALNTGSESNYDKLKRAYDWSDEQVNEALSHLTKEDWDLVQGMWDVVNSLWPEIAKLEKDLTGVEPEKIQPRSVSTPYGSYSGGYFPVVYDPRFSAAGQKQAADSLFEDGATKATTPKGHTKARIEQFAAPILLDLDVIPAHISKVTQDLSHRKAVSDVWKIVNNSKVRTALNETLGTEYAAVFKPWVQSIANDRFIEGIAAQWWLRFMRKIRMNTSIVAMGLKWTTMIQQPVGITQSLDVVPGKHLTKGLVQFSKNPLAARDFVFAKSDQMKHRMNNLDRDLRDAMRSVVGKSGMIPEIQRVSMLGIGIFDMTVSIPTWIGGYSHALEMGYTEEQAVKWGDRAVRLSQGSGSAKDLSAIQRSNEATKLITMFYSYFNALYNRLRDVSHSVKGIKDFPAVLMRSFILVVIPSILSELLAGRGPDDDEDPEEWAVRKVALYPLMTIPLMRDVAASIDLGFSTRFSPAGQAFEDASRMAKYTNDWVSGDREGEEVLAQALKTSGYFVGLPTNQVSITGGYLWDYMSGEEDDFNPAWLLYRRPKD